MQFTERESDRIFAIYAAYRVQNRKKGHAAAIVFAVTDYLIVRDTLRDTGLADLDPTERTPHRVDVTMIGDRLAMASRRADEVSPSLTEVRDPKPPPRQDR